MLDLAEISIQWHPITTCARTAAARLLLVACRSRHIDSRLFSNDGERQSFAPTALEIEASYVRNWFDRKPLNASAMMPSTTAM